MIRFPGEVERWRSQARMVSSLSPEERIRASLEETGLIEHLLETSPVKERQRAMLEAEETEARSRWIALAHRVRHGG